MTERFGVIYMLKQSFCLIVAICLILSGCDIFDRSEKKAIITVGERIVNEAELKRDIIDLTSGMGLTDQSIKETMDSLISRLVDEYLVLEYGRQNGITISEQELESEVEDAKEGYPEEKFFQEMLLRRYLNYDEWKEGLRRHLLIKKIIEKIYEGIPAITAEEINAYYISHETEFTQPPMVKFSQIVTHSEDEAKGLRERLLKGEHLDNLARQYSTAPEAEDGGEVGWISQDALDESIDEALSSLPVGEISPVVKTPYGYHIFQVDAKRPEGPKSLEEARDEIETILILQKQEVLYSKWIIKLRELFPVRINHELLRTLELG
ncbi:MAG: peptidyl-prolyl cis-trans isomerase [Deltaproteobacteria bacterium]|nr:peptidyl-prolyl cis-trans isomerase [Deltaproteobacteria bacterium]